MPESVFQSDPFTCQMHSIYFCQLFAKPLNLGLCSPRLDGVEVAEKIA